MVQTYEIIQKMLDFKYTIKELEEINENYFRKILWIIKYCNSRDFRFNETFKVKRH